MLQHILDLNDRVSLSLSWPMQLIHYALTVGSVIRMNCHIYTSLFADLNPALADRDVTLASPCLELRDHATHDLTARIVSAGVALVMVGFTLNLGISTTTRLEQFAVAFGAVNLAVPLFDPIWYALDEYI